MDKKKKLILSIIIFILGTCFNLVFTTNLHFLLKREIKTLQMFGLIQIITSMINNKEHLLLFIAFDGFVLLMAIFYFILNHKPYQSELVEITPIIKTPVSAGQRQFGSARWLTDKEKDEHFKSVVLDKNNKTMKDLKRLAKNEVSNMKKGVEIDDSQNEETHTAKEYEDKLYEENQSAYAKQTDTKESKEDKTIESGGIVVGYKKEGRKERVYYIDDDTHTLCIGATRSGKSRCIVLETIGILALSGESIIISDPKSELYNYTAPFLRNLGYEVKALDFKNPLKADRYNFLQPIIDAIDEDDIPRAVEATWDLTAALVPEDSHNEKI
ncbi:type IV secretory system conjugative DNA transfer family protein [Clostridiaceae bacterium M8S5]|nr:type IV secretory system conjugative DNA transfer family protein [Clostridiaceae bacterium M8S5]